MQMKFDSTELEVLVEEANEHLNNLQQINLNITKEKSEQNTVCVNVNAVGKQVYSPRSQVMMHSVEGGSRVVNAQMHSTQTHGPLLGTPNSWSAL